MKIIFYMLTAAMLATACVPQRKFQDLKKDYDAMQKTNADCKGDLAAQQELNEKNNRTQKEQADRLEALQRERDLLDTTNRKINSLYAQTNDAYERLLDKVKELESRNKIQKQEMSAELLETQRKLNEKEVELQNKEQSLGTLDASLNQLKSRLNTLEKDLKEREKRVAELSNVLNQKDSMVKGLRNTIANALLSFKDQGLSVNVKNGKVYVSVEEKLLFQSGKYDVNKNGREALLKLAEVLKEQKDIGIMVEGHTDNVPYRGSGVIKDNLDLSVLRATEVARLLVKDGGLAGERVVSAGRGDTNPVADNSTPEGRAKNRRTEIILTPNLGDLFKVLEQN